jgi:hypothetical protein
MKSILKQVLTVVLLLSVPAVFAAEQKEAVAVATVAAEKAATGVMAKMKAKLSDAGTYVAESRAGKFVAEKSQAAYGYAKDTRVVKFTAKKAGQLRDWTWNANDTKLKTAGKVALVGTAAAALAYGIYKIPAAIRAVRNYMRPKAATIKNAAPVVAPVVKAGPSAEQVETAKGNIRCIDQLAGGMKLTPDIIQKLNDAKTVLAAAA